ncbi:DUF4198 domain-containing protein [Marinomonas ostreistagni]|uniref:DUF4198 domain-containing protein n=1 Tax=Marinomonas ostreistagni TaxID=359209 RepID=UPI001951FD1D|nr:DUF4198 domain-containing protein [Marinomonas ostreistagni]MBM6550965.1 DUF4198 domain-containing protein [Marinomonas ostreistagni]
MFKATLCALGLLAASSTMAHELMIMPAKSIITEAPASVAVDISASHGVFRFDKPVGADNINVYGANGKRIRNIGTVVKSASRTSFDLPIDENGTYKIVYGGSEPMYMTTYTIGKRDTQKRLRGSLAQVQDLIPEDAKNIETIKMSRYGMSFVTAKMPTEEVINPTNEGFEIIPVTHPADYINGEELEFQALLDGEAVEGVEITVKAEAALYNGELEPIKATTDEDGMASIEIENAGRYAATFGYQGENPGADADKAFYTVFYTFEVVYE